MIVRSARNALVLLLITAGISRESRAQTIELKSAHVDVLKGAERDRFLAAHNAARRDVRVEPVGWSDALAKYALSSLEKQKDKLIDDAKAAWSERRVVLPEHRANPKYGENVAAWFGKEDRTAEWAVMMWLREKAAFDKINASSPYRVGDEEGKSEIDPSGRERPVVVGHYTAIVWKTTTHIGAAKLDFELTDGQGDVRRIVEIVCNYDPPGNKRSKTPY